LMACKLAAAANVLPYSDNGYKMSRHMLPINLPVAPKGS
jgi:hypothetical protein